jgi:hypothetical protein
MVCTDAFSTLHATLAGPQKQRAGAYLRRKLLKSSDREATLREVPSARRPPARRMRRRPTRAAPPGGRKRIAAREELACGEEFGERGRSCKPTNEQLAFPRSRTVRSACKRG